MPLITKGIEFVEDKRCITFTRICCNLGKAANIETGYEEYYCGHDFPSDCSQYGCPHYGPMKDKKSWELKKLTKRQKQMLQRG